MNVLRIVIASPSDVALERDAIDRIVADLNRSVAADRGIHLQTVRWDIDACPGLQFDGPQALIDALLRIEDCDCLVALFWKRFGTLVKDADAGTRHELSEAMEQWRASRAPDILVYLSEAPGFERLVRSDLSAWLERVRPLTPGSPATEELPHRLDYIKRYRELIEAARSEILICTSKLHRSDALGEAAEINRALKDARMRGVEIQILQSSGFDRLAGALELSIECGVDVRFDPALATVDVSFACVDHQCALIARRDASQDPAAYRRSTSWTMFRSTSLTAILRRELQARWTAFGVRSIALLLRELLPGAVDELGASAVSHQLHAAEDSIVALTHPLPIVVFMMGRPGSGKTTITKALMEGLARAAAPFKLAHVSDLAFVRRTFEDPMAAAARAVRTEDGGWFITDPGLYDDALRHLADLVEWHRGKADIIVAEFARRDYGTACRLLQERGVEADVMVYLDVPFVTALRRNELRFRAGTGHFVSDREMRETYQYDDVSVLRSEPAFCLLPNDELQLGGAERAARVVFDGIRKIAPAIRLT